MLPPSLEILVYNVSHSDLVLGVKTPSVNGGTEFFSRPKFSTFQDTSKIILDALLAENENKTERKSAADERKDDARRGKKRKRKKTHVLHTKMESAPKALGCNVRGEAEDDGESLLDITIVPLGLALREQSALETVSWDSFHFRQSANLKEQSSAPCPAITSVYFPLLSQVVHAWNSKAARRNPSSLKIIFLISGAGRPQNKGHSTLGNSTQATSAIMTMFLSKVYPRCAVTSIDSGVGVFQYDENIEFVRRKLCPKIEELCRGMALGYGEDWKRRFSLSIALTDGATARVAALNAALRSYRPFYFHMWQLKTFWHEHRMLSDDLSFQTFEAISTNPAVPVDDVDAPVRALVREMVAHRDKFFQSCAGKSGDMEAFWLRKSRSPVLSVLMIQKPGDPEITFYRGLNVEVVRRFLFYFFFVFSNVRF